MPRLIWVFAGRTVTLLVLSCCGSNVDLGGLSSSAFLQNWNWNVQLPTEIDLYWDCQPINEPPHDKTNKMVCASSEDSDQSGHPPGWSASSLSAWRKLGSLTTHWAHSEDSDQTGRMPSLIWVFAGRTAILLVLTCRGSDGNVQFPTGIDLYWDCQPINHVKVGMNFSLPLPDFQSFLVLCLFVCVGVLRPSQQRGHVEPVS